MDDLLTTQDQAAHILRRCTELDEHTSLWLYEARKNRDEYQRLLLDIAAGKYDDLPIDFLDDTRKKAAQNLQTIVHMVGIIPV